MPIMSLRFCSVLIFLFLLSVLVRLPTLNRPLSKHHEFCTAVALRVMQVWEQGGISNYGFNPAMNYPNAADKFINNHASGSGKMHDEQGNYYYTSHPPLAYYLPFFIFKATGLKPDVLPLQLLNLFIHLLCGTGVFLILSNLFSNSEKRLSIPALAGYAAYLFSPATLWFHSNVYMSDMLVQLFFIYGVYAAMIFYFKKNRQWVVALFMFSFLMTLSPTLN